jgi:hypothetical protein
MASLLAAVVLITATSPQSSTGILGVSTVVFCLMMTSAYILAERRGQMRRAVLVGALAVFPFAWINIHPDALDLRWSNAIYLVNLSFFLLFTLFCGLMVFRSIMAADRIRNNEIFGAIYLYLLIGVLFAEAYQVLLVWQPNALFFDPTRFPSAHVSANRFSPRGVGEVFYYSFITLGTVGYGDVTPCSPVARSLSLIESVAGIMYVATMIARFVPTQSSRESSSPEREESEPVRLALSGLEQGLTPKRRSASAVRAVRRFGYHGANGRRLDKPRELIERISV